jgi:hypothetical protein
MVSFDQKNPCPKLHPFCIFFDFASSCESRQQLDLQQESCTIRLRDFGEILLDRLHFEFASAVASKFAPTTRLDPCSLVLNLLNRSDLFGFAIRCYLSVCPGFAGNRQSFAAVNFRPCHKAFRFEMQ